jgi:cbb3-type cytochrome oxidase maturation protein
MDILYLLVPLALALAFGAVMAFRWAAQNDQFDDLETPAIRMLLDDEEEPND